MTTLPVKSSKPLAGAGQRIVGEAPYHGTPDSNSYADDHIPGDAKHPTDQHQPPGQTEDQRHQRPDEAGGLAGPLASAGRT